MPGAALIAMQEGVPVLPVAVLRLERLEARPPRADLGRVRRADALRRPAAGTRKGYKRGDGGDRGRDPAALGVPRRDPPARPSRRPSRAAARPRDDRADLLGTVAIVGFPNVGKSTLVNRLSATRQAVVFETPGVTRDRKEIVCEWAGRKLLLVDTGGVDLADDSPLTRQVAEQARRAVDEADLVLFVVDAQPASRPGTRRSPTSCAAPASRSLVLANKIDDPRRDDAALEFHALGLGDPVAVSALHGHGTGDLLDRLVEELERAARTGPRRGGGGGDPRRDPRPAERRQVEPPERDRRRGARDRLRQAGHDARRDRHDRAARRADVRLRGHGGPAPQAPAAPGDRVLLGAARDPGGRARRRRARPRRLERGHGRPGPARGRRRPHGRLLDARRPLEVGHHDDRRRGRPAAARRAAAAAPAARRRLGAVGARGHPPARPDRGALRQAHRADPDARAERLPPGAARPAARADEAGQGTAAQPPLRDADRRCARRSSRSSSTTRRS